MPPEIPPLVPPECDLRDFAFMPLEVARLRRSKAWLKAKKNPALAFYLINLWTASWHDLPAGSLEDDDDVLADLARCDPAKWPKVKEDVLRGWLTCADGRLYHPVVAEKAHEAWKAKLAQRARTEAARQARAAGRQSLSQSLSQTQQAGAVTEHHRLSVALPTVSVTESVTETATESKGEGQREGEGLSEEEPSALSAAKLPPCPHLRLIDLFVAALPDLPHPKPELWKGKKSDHMRKRWVWVLTAKKTSGKRYAETADDAVDFFARFFGYVAKSDFLTGRNGKWTACNLAWLMEEENFAKVIEGHYENKAAA